MDSDIKNTSNPFDEPGDEIPGKNGGLRRWIKFGILILVTGMVYTWLVKNLLSKEEALAIFSAADWRFLGLALALALLKPVICAARWFMVLLGMGQRVGFVKALLAVCAGYPINLFTPSMSGDFFRAWALRREIRWTHTVGSIAVERLIDLSVLAFIGTLGALSLELNSQALIAGCMLLGIIGVFFILTKISIAGWPIPEKIKNKVSEMLNAVELVAQRPKYLLLTLLISLIQWLLVVVGVTLVCYGLGYPIDFFIMAGSVPLAIFVGLIPVTIGGMGTRDAALIMLLAGSLPSDIALLLGISYGILYYLLIGLIGIVPLLHFLGDRR